MPLEVLCLRSISVFPISPCMDAVAKNELWCGLLLGDWGFVVWNVPCIRSVVLPVKAFQSISAISFRCVYWLMIRPTLGVKTMKCYLFLWIYVYISFSGRTSNCYLIVAEVVGGADISFSLSLAAGGPAIHKAWGCHTHSVCSTWANRL